MVTSMVKLGHEKVLEHGSFSTLRCSKLHIEFLLFSGMAHSEDYDDVGNQNGSEMVSQIDQETDLSELVFLLLFTILWTVSGTLKVNKKRCRIEAGNKCLICKCPNCFCMILGVKQGVVLISVGAKFAS